MNLEDWRVGFMSLPAAVEEIPFGPEFLVYKVAGKIFGILAWQDEPMRINLKCEPNCALSLRDTYPAVTAGYHMNKTHWNTILLDGTIDESTIKAWVVDSYDLIFNALPKRVQAQMTAQNGFV